MQLAHGGYAEITGRKISKYNPKRPGRPLVIAEMDGSEVWLTPREARKIAAQLVKAANASMR